MAKRRKERLIPVDPPRVGSVLSAPPTLKFSNHTIDYTCGHCGVVLMHAEQDQVHDLVIKCTKCGTYNRT